MASVAICPYCDSQLAVPSGLSSDARVECPACRQQFELSQVEWRSIPEVLPVARSASATTVADLQALEAEKRSSGAAEQATSERADAEIAAWFGANKTVAEVAPVGAGGEAVEAKSQAEFIAEAAVTPAQKPSTVTLADLLPTPAELHDEPPPGPSFELPNVPLVRENAATIEFDSPLPLGDGANTEFELDDVDFESTRAEAVAFNEPFANEPDFARTAAGDVPFVIERPSARGKSRPRALRTLVGAALGGLFGLGVGYLVLLYLLGPSGDFLGVARYLPREWRSASFARPAPPTTVAEPAEMPNANVPVSHVEPIDSPIATTNTTPSPPPREPATFHETPAVPLPTDAPVPEVRHVAGPEYTADQLFAALRAAEKALPGLVTGDLSDQTVRRTKGQSYEKFCDLAHAVTFRDPADDTAAQLADQASELFRDALGDTHTRDEAARIAGIWIDYPNRRHGGVLLVGKLRGGQIVGDVYEYQLELPTSGAPLVILAPQPIDAAADAETSLAIVGTIVPQPADEVAGYTGTAERAIWVGRAIPLP